MTKQTILQFNETQESINQLYAIINTSIDDEEVFYARIKAGFMLYNQHYYVESKEHLIETLDYFKHQKEDPLYDQVLTRIIDSLLILTDREALKYINIRKESLAVLDYYKYTLNLIDYKKAFDEDYYSLIDSLKETTIPKETLIDLLLERLLNNPNIDLVSEINEIKNLQPNETLIKDLDLMLYEHLYETNQTEKLLETLEENSLLEVFYKILIYVKQDDFKKTQILEVEHEHEFFNLPLNLQKRLYETLVTFYNKHLDLRSVETYERNLKKVNKDISKEEKQAISPKFVPAFSIPKLGKEPLEIGDDVKEIVVKKNSFNNQKPLYLLDKFIIEVLSINKDLSLHEHLRRMFVLMSKYFEFSDILIYLKPQVFHYKVERLYEKKYDRHTIDASLLGISANNYTDIIEKVNIIKYDYDIITNQPLTKTDVKQVYCYALPKKSSMCFYQRKEKELLYDDLTFKLLSDFVAYELGLYNHLNKVKQNESTMTQFFNSHVAGFSIYKNQTYIGNEHFNALFKLKKDDTIEQFLKLFQPIDQIEFRNQYQKLEREEIDAFEIEIPFDNQVLWIKQVKHDEIIYGIYLDVTNQVKEKESWIAKALTNPTSNLLTLHEFELRFDSFTNSKTTFILLELDGLDHLESIYGKAYVYNYFIDFSLIVSSLFELVYQYDSSTLLIVLELNDIRAVEKQIAALNQLILKENAIREGQTAFKYNMGVIRYPVNTKETSLKKIYAYLSQALYKAKMIHSNKTHQYFNYEDYQQDIFETEVINQIDRLITSETLLLNFTQIVNQTTNKVYAYDVNVYSPSLQIDEAYYYTVAYKRGMIEKLDKYILRETFKALSEIYFQTKKYIKLSVTIHSETLSDQYFIPFLIGLYKSHGIPYHVLDIVVAMKDGKMSDYEKLKELSALGILIGTDTLNFIKESQTKIFHFKDRPNNLDDKFLNFIKNMKVFTDAEQMSLVIYHVNRPKDQLLLKQIGIDYIRGRMVDKTFTFEEIIRLIKGAL
ncbi:MAG: EAL domain-containing protein [Acholeplasmataceae bacterium]|nr:EAL domain-containing protein [Acholeplasmataceae bacterium]